MTIYEIACLAGVSTATVSRVLNNSHSVSEKTRKKVEAVIKREDYIPNAYAHCLTTKQSQTIGIICPDISDANHAAPVAELSRHFRSMGYEILLIDTASNQESKKPYFSSLINRQVEAAVVISCNPCDEETEVFQYAASHFPVFILNGRIDGENIYCTHCNETAAAGDLVKLLCASGHEKILYIYDSHTYSGMMKLNGYASGMNAYSTQPAQTLFIDNHAQNMLPYAIDKISSVLDSVSFDAVMAADDLLAIAAEKALNKAGHPSVPMIGFNNSSLSISATPELSSVDIRLSLQCEIITHAIPKVLAGEHPDSLVVVDAKLHVRESLLRFGICAKNAS